MQLAKALFQTSFNTRFIQIATNENELTGPGFSGFPETIPEDAEAVIYTVEDGTARVVGEAKEAFGAIDLLGFREFFNPLLQAIDIKWRVKSERMGRDIVMMPRGKFVEKFWVNGEFVLQVEDVHVEEFLEIDLGMVGAKNLRLRVEFGEFGFDEGDLHVIDEIDFVEQEVVGHHDLFASRFLVLHLSEDLFGIDDGDDGVEADEFLQRRDVRKSLRNGAGVGDARRFDQDVVEAAFFQKFLDAFNEVFADGAADAAITHFEEFVFLVFNELAVNTNFADFVDDNSKFIIVLPAQYIVEKGGFARAEKAGENGNGDDFLRHVRNTRNG